MSSFIKGRRVNRGSAAPCGRGKVPCCLLLAALALLLAGCAPLNRTEQSSHPGSILLNEGSPIGQTFLAKYDGLEGIAIFIKGKEGGRGEVILNLTDSMTASNLIRKATFPLGDIAGPGYYRFYFDPVEDSSLQSYFVRLRITGQGGLLIGTGSGNSFLNGALYENGTPQNAQLAFRLSYRPGKAIGGLLREALTWLGLTLAFSFLFLLPGWALLKVIYPLPDLGWAEKAGLSTAIGFAVYPLLFLWADLVKIKITLPLLMSIPSIGAASVFYLTIRNLRGSPPGRKSALLALQTWVQDQDWRRNLTYVLVLGMVAFTRFWPTRTLDAPLWGDSYQHTLISQLLVDHQGLFRSWEPYAESLSFTYHFGFHTLVAAFHWLTDMDLIKATLWMGQMMNLMAVLAIVPLASKAGGSRWSGLIAILVAGLLSPMPMVYLNWGRYTQLAGQTIMPAAIWLIWSAVESKDVTLKTSLLAWILVSGLFLTHYRVMVFLLAFYLVMLLINLRRSQLLSLARIYSYHAFGAVLASLPWILRLFEGKLPAILGEQIAATARQVPASVLESNAIGDLTGYLPLSLWLLLLGAFLLGLIRRRTPTLIIALWWLIIFLAANPHLLGLPGTGALSNFAVLIAAYIPAGLLIGSIPGGFHAENQSPCATNPTPPPSPGSSWVIPKFLRSGLLPTLLPVLFVVIGVVAVPARLRDVKISEHALVTRPDIEAGSWIQENVSEEAKFLVNSFFAYQDTLVVGSDAGWWLPLISGRKTTQPPINYAIESEPWPGYIQETNDLIRDISRKGINHPEVLKDLLERGVSHVYIGQQQGRVNGPPLLDAQTILNSSAFRLIYHKNLVWVFEITPPE